MDARMIQPGKPAEFLDARFSVLLILLMLALSHSSFAALWPPQDHGGADVTLADGDIIWGLHSNIGNFVIPDGATVIVAPYDGASADHGGGVEIHAQTISVGGVLTATGRGFTGGGGAGGAGAGYFGGGYPGGAGGLASYGAGLFDGATAGGRFGAAGGIGDGAYAGMGGSGEYSPDYDGKDGGYAGSGSNGDSTIDASTQMGSGGGGGGTVLSPSRPAYSGSADGENAKRRSPIDLQLGFESPAGGGGGAGGRGGGQIRLIAATTDTVTSTAIILTDGVTGGNGEDIMADANGANGGDVEPFGLGLGGKGFEGTDGGPGGSGAGGGILLEGASLELQAGATISSLGGRSQTSNGGTVKIVGVPGNTLPAGVNVASGRTYFAATIDAEPPASAVDPLSSETMVNPFPVTWSGEDETNGSGIASYTIYVSTNGGAFAPWLQDVETTQALFTGLKNNTYAFYSIATDHAGNVEAAPPSADTTTLLTAPQADISVVQSGSDMTIVGAPYHFSIYTANSGPDPATNVVTSDTLPGDVTLVSAPGCLFTTATSLLTCELGTLAAGAGTTINITVTPTQVGTISNVSSAASDAFDPDYSNNASGIVTLVENRTVVYSDNQFISTTGWSQLGQSTVTASTSYDAAFSALSAHIDSDPANNWRIIGWWTTDNGNAYMMPYSAVGSNRFVRAKYYIFASGQSGVAANEIPNFRMRVANRFAITAQVIVASHYNADPEATKLAGDIRPSTTPGAPSLYRVDLDPVDVPQLTNNPTTEGFLRAFEVYEPDPQANGNIEMTESIIGSYFAIPDSDSLVPVTWNGLIKSYLTSATDAGDFGNGDVATSNSAATIAVYRNSVLDTATSQPSIVFSNAGVTMETLNVSSDCLGVAALDVFNDLGDQANHVTRARVEPGRQYKIRFHATSTKQSNSQSLVRFRARTIKFAYTASMEIGGSTGASVQSNTIAAQALPGIGNQIPPFDRIDPTENGGWYNVLMVSPMNHDIRPTQPNLDAQDAPGVDTQPANNKKSRRDLQFGFDVIDTFSTEPNSGIEAGQMTVDRVDIEKYDLVPD